MRSRLGRMIVLPPSQHDGSVDDPDVVAMVYLYGSRGGFRDVQLIGADDAAETAR